LKPVSPAIISERLYIKSLDFQFTSSLSSSVYTIQHVLVSTLKSTKLIYIKMPEHTYKFNVSMSCGGCSGAVDRVLKRLDGK
jgi:hypothetical protein